jgi:molybdopterin converting factor subunit 1
VSVSVLYFAWVRERVGISGEQVTLDGPMSVGALVDLLAARSAEHALVLGDRVRLRAAVNQDFVGWEAAVVPGDEVAIFPPVTGG